MLMCEQPSGQGDIGQNRGMEPDSESGEHSRQGATRITVWGIGLQLGLVVLALVIGAVIALVSLAR
jgi:hypothetical protein